MHKGYAKMHCDGSARKKQKRYHERLRTFIELDNHSALDVGHLCKGLSPFSCPEADEEVNTLRKTAAG